MEHKLIRDQSIPSLFYFLFISFLTGTGFTQTYTVLNLDQRELLIVQEKKKSPPTPSITSGLSCSFDIILEL